MFNGHIRVWFNRSSEDIRVRFGRILKSSDSKNLEASRLPPYLSSPTWQAQAAQVQIPKIWRRGGYRDLAILLGESWWSKINKYIYIYTVMPGFSTKRDSRAVSCERASPNICMYIYVTKNTVSRERASIEKKHIYTYIYIYIYINICIYIYIYMYT